jgi:hypothetical protein
MKTHDIPVDEMIDPFDADIIVAYLLPDEFDHALISWEEAMENAIPLDPPPHNDDIDHYCDCHARNAEDQWMPALEHDPTCDLHNHTPWMNGMCEFVPGLCAMVYTEDGLAELEGKTESAPKPTPAAGSPWDDDDEWWGSVGYGTYTPAKPGVQTAYVPKCRHYEVKVTLPDGTVVWPSSMNNRKADDATPDFGIYADRGWQPRGYPALMVPWPDFGLPDLSDQALLDVVHIGLERARAGFTVELGCIGGHGRTGTLLGLMAIHAGLHPDDDPVDWVHKNYCKEAVEGERQRWFLAKHRAMRNGWPLPPKPASPPPAPPMTASFQPSAFTTAVVDKSMTVVGKCPQCKTHNNTKKNHTEGYCCSNQKCAKYGIRLDTDMGRAWLQQHKLLVEKK